MSTQRLAILAAVSTNNLMKNSTEMDKYNQYQQYNKESEAIRPNGQHYHGNVNVLLGGAMLSLFITVICFVCYCCHRNLKKRSESLYRQRWLETDPNMDIYSVEQCYDMSSRHGPSSASIEPSVCQLLSTIPPLHAPPPSYETVVAMDQRIDGCIKCSKVIGVQQLSLNRSSTINQTIYPCSNIKVINHNEHHKCDNQPNFMEPGDINVSGTSSSNNVLNQDNLIFGHSSRECHCNGFHYELFRRCRICGKVICFSNHAINPNLSINEQYCRCFTTRYLMNNNKCMDMRVDATTTDDNGNNSEHENNSDGSRNVPCSSTSIPQFTNINPIRNINDNNNNINDNNDDNGRDEYDDDDDEDDDDNFDVNYTENNSNARNNNFTVNAEANSNYTTTNNNDNCTDTAVNFETLNANGLIRMDMSQIIDQTGLPTYEAALKLESSGYV